MLMSFKTMLIMFFAVVTGYGQIVAPSASKEPICDEKEICLTLQSFNLVETKLEFEYELRNSGDGAVYVATHPVQVSGERGYYISMSSSDSSLLRIESRIFAPPDPSPYSNKTRVELRRLERGDVYRDRVVLMLPMRETFPPLEAIALARKISYKDIKSVNLTLGYFVDEPHIATLLKGKPQGWFIRGHETVSNTKRFFQIQRLISRTFCGNTAR